MGDILPFVARLRESADWTASERARLQALGERFAEAGAQVEVIYGATDDGDPWCVVKDENEEVLVHVARIGGRFVVHFATDDTLEEGSDLPSALSERLIPPQSGSENVVPFNLASRQAQTLMALIVATAFFYETRELLPVEESGGGHLQATESPDVAAAVTVVPDEPALRQERELAANGAVLADPAPQPGPSAAWSPQPDLSPMPSPAAPAADDPPPLLAMRDAGPAQAAPIPSLVVATQAAPPREIVGSAHDDLLVGGAGAERILGGAGADTLQGGGAEPGRFDTLDGGAGDDRIELSAQVVATGGQGADSFVVQAPVVMGQAATLLGVVTDFRTAEGDLLIDARGEAVVIVQWPPTSVAPPTPGLVAPDGTQMTTSGDARVFVDLNGDGIADGYVLMGTVPPAEVVAEDTTPALAPGASFTHYELA